MLKANRQHLWLTQDLRESTIVFCVTRVKFTAAASFRQWVNGNSLKMVQLTFKPKATLDCIICWFVFFCRHPKRCHIWRRPRRDGDSEGHRHVLSLWASLGALFWKGKCVSSDMYIMTHGVKWYKKVLRQSKRCCYNECFIILSVTLCQPCFERLIHICLHLCRSTSATFPTRKWWAWANWRGNTSHAVLCFCSWCWPTAFFCCLSTLTWRLKPKPSRHHRAPSSDTNLNSIRSRAMRKSSWTSGNQWLSSVPVDRFPSVPLC